MTDNQKNRYIYLVSTEDLNFLERFYELVNLQKYETDLRPKVVTSVYIKLNEVQRYDMVERKLVNISDIMNHKFLI